MSDSSKKYIELTSQEISDKNTIPTLFPEDSSAVSLKKDFNEEYVKPYDSELKIGSYEEAPDYLKDNEYIKTGYLLNCNTVKLLFRSLFKCSNESTNIWSHLLGSLFAFFLIFFTLIFVKGTVNKEFSKNLIIRLKTEFKKIIIPWINSLRLDINIELFKNKSKEKISLYINYINEKVDNIIDNFGTKFTNLFNVNEFFVYMEKAISNINNLIVQNYEPNLQNDLTSKWKSCENKIINFLKEEIDDPRIIEDMINKERIGRWPLFISITSGFICMGFSTIFHWFGAYGKKLSNFLSRFDYAGIAILIAGSCYPPYYFFYYCQKCKFY